MYHIAISLVWSVYVVSRCDGRRVQMSMPANDLQKTTELDSASQTAPNANPRNHNRHPPAAYMLSTQNVKQNVKTRGPNIERRRKEQEAKAQQRKAREVFELLSQIFDESDVNPLKVHNLQDLKDQQTAMGQFNNLSNKLLAARERSERTGEIDYETLDDIVRWLGEHDEIREVSWRELIEKHSAHGPSLYVRLDELRAQFGQSSLEEYLANVWGRRYSSDSNRAIQRARPLKMLFDKLESFFMPTTGPISLKQENFAIPSHPNLTRINADPPVYEILGFLSEEECADLIKAANAGEFPEIPYGRNSKIFTGTKWAAAGTEVVKPFVQRTKELFGEYGERLEPVTVTRYEKGEYQAKHLDSRLPHEVKRTAAHFKTGGQRIAQIIVYLQPANEGGGTKFFNPLFNNLEVQPEVGKALVFPTATNDGEADERYLHSAEPVLSGSKYIVGTWLMECERTDADDIRNAIKQLWAIQKKSS